MFLQAITVTTGVLWSNFLATSDFKKELMGMEGVKYQTW
jgi:hypothetical protein